MGGAGALAGLRVIDLSRVLGGPYCTQILGDHGADVLKVEPPQGDETRTWGPPFAGGTSAYFQGVNRNKRGICLDLKQPDAREALLGLLEGADVLVENFKPGTLEGWGLTIDYLSERFPRLIHCRISGFGDDGPLGGLPGYDAAIQAMVGLMSVNGDRDGAPTRLGVPIVDMASGLNGVIGILMALQERERSGRGQFVDVALFDCGISILHPHAANFFASGKVPGRSGSAHPNISPYNAFPTAKGDIFIAVGNDGQFRKLCQLLGAASLADNPRYASNAERSIHREDLKVELDALLVDHEAVALADLLIRNGVPCGPVLTVAQSLELPHTRHRKLVVEQGDYSGIGAPVKLSRTPATYRRLPPKFGEHNDAILSPPAAIGIATTNNVMVTGRYFNQWQVGDRIEHPLRRTVTETDNLLISTLTHNPQPLHLDAEYAAGTQFGRIVVNGTFTFGLTVGISVAETTVGTLVANLGFDKVVFPKPVFVGDTLHITSEVTQVRESRSASDAGIVTFLHRAINQRGEVVCECLRVVLLRKSPT